MPLAISSNGDSEWLLPVVEAAVYLGLRRGELVSLRWGSVDLKERKQLLDEVQAPIVRHRDLEAGS